MKQKQPHIIDIIFVLALFGVFALSAMALIIVGADIYQSTVDNMQVNYEIRTSTSYLSEKTRRSSTAEISDLNGVEALRLSDTINEREYYTYLYCYEGYLKELLIASDSELGDNILSAGQNITELYGLDFQPMSENIIKAKLSFEDGSDSNILIHSYKQ